MVVVPEWSWSRTDGCNCFHRIMHSSPVALKNPLRRMRGIHIKSVRLKSPHVYMVYSFGKWGATSSGVVLVT
ncbi:hypothetical protein TNCV_4238641 [Trichonephila clavipes]|nr:hypothetical protein TNCV_4238641 [Trichonephila clavipes]